MPGLLKPLFTLLIEYFFNFTSPFVPLNEHCKREIETFSYVSNDTLYFLISCIKQSVNEVELKQILKAIKFFILEEPLKLVVSDYTLRNSNDRILYLRTRPDLYQTLLNNPHLRLCK